MSGWVKMHRNITKWEWYDDSKMVHLFFHLVVSANHKEGNWKGQEVKRGQLITGRKKLSSLTGISEQSIRTCLDRLVSTNEITIKPTSKNSLITILNYDLYQESEIINQQSTIKSTNNQPTINQRSTTNKNDNNVKNEKKVKEVVPPTQTILDFNESEHEHELVGGFRNFVKFIEETKHVKIFESQITIQNYKKICDEHGRDKLWQKITDLDNWLDDPNVAKGKKKGKKSVYHLMVNTWLKNGY
jgi:hypothetical protein